MNGARAVSVFPEASAPPLRVNLTWSLAGYAGYMACQWAMLVVVARLGSPEKVGQFALGIAVSAPVILFSMLGLRKIQVTDASGRFEFAHYFGLRLLTNGLALGVVAAIAGVAGYGRTEAVVILAVGLSKAVESTSDLLYGVFQKHERMDFVATSMLLRGVSGVGALAVGMATTHSVIVGVLGLTAAWATVLFVYDLPRARSIVPAGKARPRFTVAALGRLAWIALPLGIVTTLAGLLASIPAVLIAKYWGTAELGIYTALAYSFAASQRMASAIGEAASARLARHYAEGRRHAFRRVLFGSLGLAGAAATTGLALSAVAGRPLLSFFYGPVYGDRADLLTAFMIVAVVSNLALVLDYCMTAMGRLKIQPFLSALALLVYAAIARGLIARMGLSGALVALGIVTLLQGATFLAVVLHGLRRFPTAMPAASAAGGA